MNLPQPHRTVDGVPVWCTDVPGITRLKLIFRVGMADESLVSAGVTHMVLALASQAAGPTVCQEETEVGRFQTDIVIEGSPADVTARLTRWCEALAGLTQQRPQTPLMNRVTQELRESWHPFVATPTDWSVMSRWDYTSAGLAAAPRAATLENLRPVDVSQHAARFFHAGNAVVVSTSLLPESLRLPLPVGGVRMPIPSPQRLDWVGPIVQVGLHECVILSFEVPNSSPDAQSEISAVLTAVMRRLMADVDWPSPTEALEVFFTHVDGCPIIASIGLAFDPDEPSSAGRVLGRAWKALDDIRSRGISDSEKEAVRMEVVDQLTSPYGRFFELEVDALHHLTGVRSAGQDVVDWLHITEARDIGGCLSNIETSLIVGLPVGALVNGIGEPFASFPLWCAGDSPVEGQEFGRSLRGRLRREPADVVLTVGETGVSWTEVGETRTIMWNDVIGLFPGHESPPRDALLVSRQGTKIIVDSTSFRRGAVAMEMIRAKVPAELQVAGDWWMWMGPLPQCAPHHPRWVLQGLTT